MYFTYWLLKDMICLFIKFLWLELLICMFECMILKSVLMKWWIFSMREVITSFDHATSDELLHVWHLLLNSFMQMKQLKLWDNEISLHETV